MPANDFEKQVQQQLDDFQLNPSASVWRGVEEEIRNKKRRRIIFFIILPFILLMLGFSAYYFMHSGKEPGIAHQTREKNEDASTAGKSTPGKKDNSIAKEPVAPALSTGKTTLDKTPDEKIPPAKDIAGENERLDISSTQPKRSRAKSTRPVQKTEEQGTAKGKQPLSSLQDKKIDSPGDMTVTIDNAAAGTVAKTPATKDIEQPKTKEDNTTTATEPTPVKKDSAQTENIAATTKTKSAPKGKTRGMTWGVDVSTGISSTHSEMFSLVKSNYDAMAVNSPAGSPAGPVVPPSEPRPGLYFSLGVRGEWKLSKRSSFSTGLQYTYASNRIRVGNIVDTSISVSASSSFSSATVDQIYRGSKQNDYTNRYHFVTIPLEYHWMINKNQPLQWTGGLSLNYLFATNALVYTPSYGGIYYKDKKAFAKMHFNLNTGLSYRFGSRKGLEWAIGPSFSFDMQNLVKDLRDRQYLVYAGIEAKLFFPKKKNK